MSFFPFFFFFLRERERRALVAHNTSFSFTFLFSLSNLQAHFLAPLSLSPGKSARESQLVLVGSSRSPLLLSKRAGPERARSGGTGKRAIASL